MEFRGRRGRGGTGGVAQKSAISSNLGSRSTIVSPTRAEISSRRVPGGLATCVSQGGGNGGCPTGMVPVVCACYRAVEMVGVLGFSVLTLMRSLEWNQNYE